MTNTDKKILLHFITRTDMFIDPVDDKNIVSFIHGYETGSKCDFTRICKQLLTEKYKINHSNDGWPGQIRRLSEKNSQSWVMTFKKIVMKLYLLSLILNQKYPNYYLRS